MEQEYELEPIDLKQFIVEEDFNKLLTTIEKEKVVRKPKKQSSVNILRSLCRRDTDIVNDSTNEENRYIDFGSNENNYNNEKQQQFENLLKTISKIEIENDLLNLSNNISNNISNSDEIERKKKYTTGYEDIDEIQNVEKKDTKIQKCLKWFEEEKKKLIPKQIYPTNYSISTITTNCRIIFYNKAEDKKYNIFINYLKLFKYLECKENVIESKKYRFMSKRYNWDELHITKKPEQTNRYKKQNSKMKGIFYNQITLEIYSKISNKKITVFLYDNGSMNNTGNKCIEDTKYVSDTLINMLYEFNKTKPILYYYEKNEDLDLSNWENKDDEELDVFLSHNLKIIGSELYEGENRLCILDDNIKISTMNAQYYIGVNLIREEIYELVKSNNDNGQECGTNDGIYFVILQTSNYAGINIKIKWKNNCNEQTHIKSKKKWKCKCRDITILAFQSGEVMISGARSFEELDYAKALFDKLIQDNLEKVVDIDLSNIIPIPSQKKAKRIEKHLGTEYLQGKKFEIYDYVNDNEYTSIPVKVERRGRKPKNPNKELHTYQYQQTKVQEKTESDMLMNSVRYNANSIHFTPTFRQQILNK